ncbi:hypothetical protein CRUP_020025 [Coryphaenoides rupestris]|nr:hypothetical protein CRUP_020025 [Coryphaenoides rupestris]
MYRYKIITCLGPALPRPPVVQRSAKPTREERGDNQSPLRVARHHTFPQQTLPQKPCLPNFSGRLTDSVGQSQQPIPPRPASFGVPPHISALQNPQDGAYLVRDGTKQPYTLMVLHQEKVYNIQIQMYDQRYMLGTGTNIQEPVFPPRRKVHNDHVDGGQGSNRFEILSCFDAAVVVSPVLPQYGQDPPPPSPSLWLSSVARRGEGEEEEEKRGGHTPGGGQQLPESQRPPVQRCKTPLVLLLLLLNVWPLLETPVDTLVASPASALNIGDHDDASGICKKRASPAFIDSRPRSPPSHRIRRANGPEPQPAPELQSQSRGPVQGNWT